MEYTTEGPVYGDERDYPEESYDRDNASPFEPEPTKPTADAQGNPPPLEGEASRFKCGSYAMTVGGDGKLYAWSPSSGRWINSFTADQAFEARRHLAAEVVALRARVEALTARDTAGLRAASVLRWASDELLGVDPRVAYASTPQMVAQMLCERFEELTALVEAPRREAEIEVAGMSEGDLIVLMFRCFDTLRQRGWQDAMYAPKGTPLEVIEAGSTGVHKATRDDLSFWIADDSDVWPSDPILYRLRNSDARKALLASAERSDSDAPPAANEGGGDNG